MDTLPLTGERTGPGVAHENYWLRRHEAAYAWLAGQLDALDVLEVGCGEGYGTARLAGRARRLLALDYDTATVAHVRRRYPDLTVAQANLAALPVSDAAWDAVVALQVIEHVWDHGEFLAGCRRALRPEGLLVLTTPNRLTFSPDGPRNPFHSREFSSAELRDLVNAHGLQVTVVLGVHAGPRLGALDARHGGSMVEAQLAAAPQQWSAALQRDVGAVTTADFTIGPDRPAGLDLILLARRTG